MTIIDNLLPHWVSLHGVVLVLLVFAGGMMGSVVYDVSCDAIFYWRHRKLEQLTDDEWRLVAEERLREIQKPWPVRPYGDAAVLDAMPAFRDLAASDRARRAAMRRRVG